MRIIDISHKVQDAPLYPGSSPIQINPVFEMDKGDDFNASMIITGSHIGTHADARNHFVKGNAVGIDRMELSLFYGPCRVLTVPANTLITRETLEGKIEGCERLVIHGGGFSFLTIGAAKYILEKGIKTIVTDALSIAPPDSEAEIHRLIMSAGLAVIENATLEGVEDGDYILCAFPIKIGGCDGAPVRAVLIAED